MTNPVGSVTAEIILDTTQFEEAVETLRGQVDDIKKSFTKSTRGNGLTDEVKKLKQEISDLQNKTKNYQETIKNLREQNADYAKDIENLNKLLEQSKKAHSTLNEELKVEQKSYDNASKSASRYVKLQDRMTKWSASTFKNNLKNKGMGDLFSLGAGRNKYADFSQWTKMLNTGLAKFTSIVPMRQRQLQEWINSASKSFQVTNQEIRNASQIFNRMDAILTTTGKTLSEFNSQMQNVRPVTTGVEKAFESATRGAERYRQAIRKSSEELRKYYLENEKYYASVGAMSTKYWNQIRNSTVSTPKNWQTGQAFQQSSYNAQTVSMQNYYGNISKINKTLQEQIQIARQTKLANDGLHSAYNKNVVTLNTYKSNLNQINKVLEQQKLRTAQVQAAQASLYYKHAPNNLNTYKQNMQKINEQLERQTNNQNKYNNLLKTGQASMREFGTTMGKSEAYANNLYRGLQKVRSVIISIKTIAGALGTMAVWNFAFDLIDKAKETYSAKNEMEALLEKNSHVDAQGQQAFNQALDKTVKQFQKINKYSLGETAASVGLEFDLNGKEMAESLKVIAMVQNEYVRAGRTTEEAALAVKDILQGEFQRLSRETGVGKDDLKEKYGWNGKTDDVQDLMKALKKAGEARHWDAFAEKATSLNDVITITQSRFSEFGADLITNIEPMLVSGFNSIIGVIDTLKTGFEGLNAGEQLITLTTLGGSAIVGLSSAVLMLKKNIGLMDIAQIGWTRSIFTGITGLNRASVANYGFARTLLATLTGTEASTTANVRFSKVLAGRILGVRQATLAEYGLMNAAVQSKLALRGETLMISSAELGAMSFGQKLKYVIGNMSIADAKSASWAKTLKSLVTSARFLKLALVGIPAIGFVAWLSTVAMWTDTVKKRMEAYNDMLNEGKSKIEDATQTYDAQIKKVNELKAAGKDYSFAQSQATTAKKTLDDLKLTYKLVKDIKKQDKERTESDTLTYRGILNKSYDAQGVNTEKYNQQYFKMKYVAYDLKKAEEERFHFLYASTQHINEHVKLMKDAKMDEEARVKYITEYSTKAEEAAEHLKQFNEGDLSAGAYYLLDRLALVWIDLWNDKDFLTFWNSVKKTFSEIKPTLIWLKDTLIELGKGLMKFFSTDIGRWVGTIGLAGAGIGLLVGKLSKWITGNNVILKGLKDLGSSLVQRIKDWRNVGKAAEEANNKSTGGISGGTVDKNPKKYGSWGELGADIKQDFMGQARKFAKLAGQIALAMGVIAVGIGSLVAPLLALALVGVVFKGVEKQARDGIEGIKLVAPVVIAVAVPVMALMKVMDKWGDKIINVKMAKNMFLGIIAGMFFVAETIFSLNMPLLAIASVGAFGSYLGDNVKKGVDTIKVVADTLQYLAPFIPPLLIGVGLVAAAFAMPEFGVLALGAVALGIPVGMAIIAETILSLNIPLMAIASLSSTFGNSKNVKKGAEVIKEVAEAMTYVEEATRLMALVKWEVLAGNVADIVAQITGHNLGDDLVKLTEKDGFFDQVNKFTSAFNSDKLKIETPDPDKVTALSSVADGMRTIGDTMGNVKTAMDNLPEEFKNGGTGTGKPLLNYDSETNSTAVTGQMDVKGYFDTFKEPLKQLKEFVNEFNTSDDYDFGEGIDQSRVQAISQSADMFESLNNAVSKVKDVLGNVAMGNIMGNIASATGSNGGIPLIGGLGSIVGLIQGATSGGTGDYVSSMGGQFQEMENIIKDMTTFTNNISGLSGESSNVDVSGLASIVQQVSTQINNLKNTISNAVPTLKTNSKGLGSAIGDGLKEGFDTKIASVTPQLGNKIKSLGTTTLVPNFKNGIDKMSEAMGWELYYVGKAIDDKYDELGEKAYNLAKHMSDRFKDGDDMHSPGIISRTIQDEMGYIGQFLDGGLVDLPQKAFNLANALSSNFNFDLGLSNIQLPDLTQFTQGLSVIPSTVSNVKTQVSTNFQGMVSSVGTSLMNMKNNAVGTYTNIVANTRTSLTNMQSQTTKNISGIKTSWRGMQSALIASAEAIRSQTQTKINKIKTNLGDFWNKVKNPDQLLRSAGGKHVGSIRRGRTFNKLPSFGFAGNGSLFKSKPKSKSSPSDLMDEYYKCMITTGSSCYAGGWNYNWTPSIVKKFKGWNTHFNAYSLDKFLNVGKFENSNFPVKGNANVAKAYIFDVIRATSYDKYFNSKFGDNPVAALLSGAFNCWDGTNIVLGLARAFGFKGHKEHGTWNGVGHVWANIPGLGIIDPTAIQNRGTFKATGAVNYSGGSRKPLKSSDVATGETHNYGDVHVNITVQGNDVEVDNRKIDNRTGKQLMDILGINPATGR